MAKPIKSLELHYPMIQFLIIIYDIHCERQRLCKDIDVDKKKSFPLYFKIRATLFQRLQIK